MSWPSPGFFGRGVQLEMALDPPPHDGSSLLRRLHALGLNGIAHCVLTANRAVMVSYRGNVLRVHRCYLDAPPQVLRAIVTFVQGRSRRARRSAEQLILEHAAQLPDGVRGTRRRRTPRPRPDDVTLIGELARRHDEYNRQFFDGRLSRIAIRVSGRMRSRLGQYTVAGGGADAEITISRSHIRRHGWSEALHTLLHEMVHQWQAERGMALDHGAAFRAKAREIGIEPRARRPVQRPDVRAVGPTGSIPKRIDTE